MLSDSQHFAELDPDFIAVVDPSGETWTRGRLAALVNRLARAFSAAGLAEGDSIAIVAPNCAEYLAAYLAGVQANLYVVPVNWHLSESELEFVLSDARARVVIAHERLGSERLRMLAEAASAADLLVCIGDAPGYMPLTELTEPHSSRPLRRSGSGRVMPYTSATTGRPKAVKLPLSNASTALHRKIEWHRSLGIEIESDNVHLCTSMLYHSAPLEGCVTALHMGHRVVLVHIWQPELLLRLISEHRVTTSFMVPSMFVRLLKLPESVRAKYSTRSLRFVAHGGAPCPIDVKRRMLEWWGPIIWESYGAAEGQGTIVSPGEWMKYPGTVGRPIPGAAVKIVGDDGTELPPNRVGTIYLKPHTGDRFEYIGDPDRTRRAYLGDYITVGDVGYVNEEGYLFICDRREDLILSSGMNIYPAEIEAALVQHPLVADCAVVGVKHELLGKVPKAFVQVEPGVETGPHLTADILRFLGSRLSAMKLPKRIEYVQTVPRAPTGKLYRRSLQAADTAADTSDAK